MNRPVNVTIAVCTYNRASLLRDALESLLAQQLPEGLSCEILVVDNGSTDNTREVIDTVATGTARLVRSVVESQPGVSWARNRAVAEARGEWVAFFDDDQRAAPDWLAQLLAMANERHVQCVGGAVRLERVNPPGAPVPPPLDELLGASGRGDKPVRCGYTNAPGTGNLLIHRDLFVRVGTFNTGLQEASEDFDLFQRIDAAGYEVWYTPAAVVYHRVPEYRLSPSYLRWMSQRFGWSIARESWERNGPLPTIGWGALRVGQAMLVHGPRWAWAQATGATRQALYRRCKIWRATAYARYVLHRISPRWLSQEAFYRQLSFRGEREMYGASSEPARAGMERQGQVS